MKRFKKQVSDKSFDYVIVGGGTAGLVLAARLTEDPNCSVVVLEAGEANLDDPAIFRPGQHGSHFGQPAYSWTMFTVPQKHANGNTFPWFRGRGLGGSSAINFMAWNKPNRQEIDDWEKLGNKGWNWDDLAKYSAKSSSFVPASLSAEEIARRGLGAGSGWDKPFGDGPIKLTHPQVRTDLDIKVQETLHNMGIPRAPQPLHGDPAGTTIFPNNMDPDTSHRSYAATTYYLPNAARPNFVVLTSAYVHRIISSSEGGEIVASGVEFSHGKDENVHITRATKEVILSAGALKSPQILELSGIGRRAILQNIDVPVKLELEGVGENVQEHVWVGITFQLKDSVPDETFDVLGFPGAAEKHANIFAQSRGVYAMGIETLTFQPLNTFSENATSLHADIKADILENIQEGNYHQGLVDQYKLQLARLEPDQLLPVCELISFPGFLSFPNPPSPGKKHFTLIAAVNNLFSRGTIHVGSADPKAPPIIDPHYFEKDIDLRSLVEMVKFCRKVALNAPVNGFLDSEVVELNPGPKIQTDAEIAEWIKSVVATTYHTMGTLSMLPKDKGGVVDPTLKVYGTKNIRIVDLSVAPLTFSSHPQWAVYAIAEKAAEIIMGKI